MRTARNQAFAGWEFISWIETNRRAKRSRIPTFRIRVYLGLSVVLFSSLFLLPFWASGQPNSPHIGYVYPAGGRQGTTFEVKVGGQFLNNTTEAFVCGSGVQAKVIEYTRPMTQKEFNDLRDKFRELQDKKRAAMQGRTKRAGPRAVSSTAAWTAEDEKTLAEIRKKMATFVRRPQSPAIAETVRLQVTVDSDAVPGDREVRLATGTGLSNPLLFRIGQLPEFRKTEIKAEDDETTLRQGFRNRTEQKAVPATETSITLPAVVNGQILPGGVDRFRFRAREGQHLVIAASGRQLIPYLPDAVPGWFQPTLALYDSRGRELAYADDFKFSPDPVLYFEIPKDGEYVAEIKDSIYRGREDFVYRVEIGEMPFINGIFPLGCRAGTKATVELTGWNLGETKVTMDATGKAPGVYPLSARGGEMFSPAVPFAVDALPDGLEKEPNHTIAQAQRLAPPVIINGRIEAPGDSDVFRVEGHAGQEFVAEVQARRLNSPLDSILKLTDVAGKQIAWNDDFEDKGAGLITHQSDSRLAFSLPADGAYYLHLSDAQRKGGAEYAYRLRVSAPQPDFELRIVPSSVTLRGGASAPVTVYALRKDGFTNEITLALKDAPPGLSLSGGRIPAGQEQVRATLSAANARKSEACGIAIEGSARIGGETVIRTAVPAEDMMQAFAYRHLVPAKELLVEIQSRAFGRGSVKLLCSTPVRIPSGGTVRVPISTPVGGMGNRLQFELSEPPPGISIREVTPSNEGAEIVFASDAAQAKAGAKGNLIVVAYASPPQGAAKKKSPAAANRQRSPVGSLPAIPFEVVEK